MQYAVYRAMLGPALAQPEVGLQRRLLFRWLLASACFQGVTVAAAVVYVLLMRRSGAHGLAWIAPALGLLAGSLLPLQLAAARIGRHATRLQ